MATPARGPGLTAEGTLTSLLEKDMTSLSKEVKQGESFLGDELDTRGKSSPVLSQSLRCSCIKLS